MSVHVDASHDGCNEFLTSLDCALLLPPGWVASTEAGDACS